MQHFFSALLLFAKVNPLGENSAVLIGTCFQEEKTYKNHQLFLTNSHYLIITKKLFLIFNSELFGFGRVGLPDLPDCWQLIDI